MTTNDYDREQAQREALANARNNSSVTNYPAIFQGFIAKGIAEVDIKPRENVFTFNAWKALGRSVKKGEHGVKIVTMVPIKDQTTGNVISTSPRTATVFHISQTEPTADAEARWKANRPSTSSGQARSWKTRPQPSQGQRPQWRRPEPIVRDTDEDATDRWSESHK